MRRKDMVFSMKPLCKLPIICVFVLVCAACSSIEKKFVRNELGEELRREVKSVKEAEISYSVEIIKKPTLDDETLEARIVKTAKAETEYLGTFKVNEVQEHTKTCKPSIYYSDKCEFSAVTFTAMHIAIVGFFFDLFGGEHSYVENVTVPQDKKTMTKMRTEVSEDGRRELVRSGEATFLYGPDYTMSIRAPVKDGTVKFNVAPYIDNMFNANDSGLAKVAYATESIEIGEFDVQEMFAKRQENFDERRAAYEKSAKYAFEQFCSAWNSIKETGVSYKEIERNLASNGLELTAKGKSGYNSLLNIYAGQLRHWRDEYKSRSGKTIQDGQCEP